jgi:hypothetical protein
MQISNSWKKKKSNIKKYNFNSEKEDEYKGKIGSSKSSKLLRYSPYKIKSISVFIA